MLKTLAPYLLLLTEDDIKYGVFKRVDASLSYSIEFIVDVLIVAAPIRFVTYGSFSLERLYLIDAI